MFEYLANFLPSIIYAAVIGLILRKKAWMGHGVINQTELISISLAIVIAALASATSLFLLLPGDSPFLIFEKFSIRGIFGYSLGDVAGVLFFWSVVVFIKSFMVMDGSSRGLFFRNAAYLTLPVLAAIALLAPRFEWAFLSLMAIPIVFLALKHGWPGVTLSLMTLNVIAGLNFWFNGSTAVLFDTQIFLVSVGFTGLFLGAVVSRQAELMMSIRNISQRAITTQEAERRRISRDVHDQIGQVLTALTLRIAILKKRAPDNLKDDIDLLDQLAGQAFRDIHDVVREISPRELSHFGLKRSLESPAFQKMLGATNTSYTSSIDSRVADMPEQVQIAIFRISQEALSNIARHSRATECSLKVDLSGKPGKETVCLEIQDKGAGFDTKVATKGHGLQNVMDRTQALLGNCELTSDKNGTLLVVSLPV